MATAEVKARLSLDSMAFQAGINRAMSGMSRFQAVVVATSAQLVSFGIRSAEALARLGVVGVKSALDLGSELSELSAQTGIAVDELEKLRIMFKASGLGEEEVGRVLNKMQKFIATNEELKALSPDKQFLAIVKAIKAIEDPAERAEKAMEIFGKGGGQVLRLNIHDLEDAAKFMGSAGGILKRNAEEFDRASDILNRGGDKIKFFWVGFASRVTESILPLLEAFDKIDTAAIGQRVGDGFRFATLSFAGMIAEGQVGEVIKLTAEWGLLKAQETFVSSMERGLVEIFGRLEKLTQEMLDKSIKAVTGGLKAVLHGTDVQAFNFGNKVGTATGSAVNSAVSGGGFVPISESDRKLAELTAKIDALSKVGEKIIEQKTNFIGRRDFISDGGGLDLNSIGKSKAMAFSAQQRMGGGLFGGSAAVHTIPNSILSEVKIIGRLLQRIAGGNSQSFARIDNF